MAYTTHPVNEAAKQEAPDIEQRQIGMQWAGAFLEFPLRGDPPHSPAPDVPRLAPCGDEAA